MMRLAACLLLSSGLLACGAAQSGAPGATEWSHRLSGTTASGWAEVGPHGVYVLTQEVPVDALEVTLPQVVIERLDAQSGAVLWASAFPTEGDTLTLLPDANALLAYSREAVARYGARSGRELWRWVPAEPIVTAAQSGDFVWIQTTQHGYTLDASSGRVIGQLALQDTTFAGFAASGRRAYALQLSADAMQLSVYRVDRPEGELAWEHAVQGDRTLELEGDEVFGYFTAMGVSSRALRDGRARRDPAVPPAGTWGAGAVVTTEVETASMLRMVRFAQTPLGADEPAWSNYLLMGEVPQTVTYLAPLGAYFVAATTSWALVDAASGELRWHAAPAFGAADAETCAVVGTDGQSIFASCTSISEAYLVAVPVAGG